MNRARKLLVPSILACALLAALALAATASAEVRVGETSAPVNPALNPQADIIGADAEYDSDTGTVTFKVTTAEAPSPGTEPNLSPLEMALGLASTSVCASSGIGGSVYPAFTFTYHYVQPELVIWSILESAGAEPKVETGTAGQAAMSTSATSTTFVATAPKAANLGFNCALAEVVDGGAIQGNPVVFPIAVPPPPPPPPPVVTAPAPAPAAAATTTASAAAALSIAKAKPVKLRAGKWKAVRIEIANPGGAATAPGSLRLKAPRGVLVKPEKQRLPVLSAGGSWTVTAKVAVTAKAKKKTTVGLTATAGSLTAKGSLILKR